MIPSGSNCGWLRISDLTATLTSGSPCLCPRRQIAKAPLSQTQTVMTDTLARSTQHTNTSTGSALTRPAPRRHYIPADSPWRVVSRWPLVSRTDVPTLESKEETSRSKRNATDVPTPESEEETSRTPARSKRIQEGNGILISSKNIFGVTTSSSQESETFF